MLSGENFSQIPSLPLCLSGIVAYGVSFIGLHLTDCSTCDHGNHWILDAVIDLAKKSWGGIFEVWESSPSKGAWIKPCAEDLTAVIYQGAANKSNPLPCFVNISTTNRNFYKKIYAAISRLYLRIIAELY